jgi:hypothetical protein
MYYLVHGCQWQLPAAAAAAFKLLDADAQAEAEAEATTRPPRTRRATTGRRLFSQRVLSPLLSGKPGSASG